MTMNRNRFGLGQITFPYSSEYMNFYNHSKERYKSMSFPSTLVETSGRQVMVEQGKIYYEFEMLSDNMFSF